MDLENKLLKYTKRSSILKLDYLAEKWNCEVRNLVRIICDNSDQFGRIIFSDHAVYLNYQDHEQWYYEVAEGHLTDGKRWFDRHNYIESEELDGFINDTSGSPDFHMSVYQHDEKWIEEFNDPTSKVRTPYIYIELDRDGNLDKAIEDGYKIVNEFPYKRGIKCWWSGNTSLHIGIPSEYFGSPICTNQKSTGKGKLYYNLARRIAGSCRHPTAGFDPHLSSVDQCKKIWTTFFNEEPPDDPQRLRQRLEHFDPNLYYFNSMIRLPGSVHEKSGGMKKEIDLPDIDTSSGPPIKPYLLHWTYEAWEWITPPRTNRSHVDVSGYEGFVKEFYMEHVDGFDPREMNHQGWVTNCYSPFYEDTNPDVSICIDPEHSRFGKYHDFGNTEDNTDFVGFISRITGWSRRKSLSYIRKQSKE